MRGGNTLAARSRFRSVDKPFETAHTTRSSEPTTPSDTSGQSDWQKDARPHICYPTTIPATDIPLTSPGTTPKLYQNTLERYVNYPTNAFSQPHSLTVARPQQAAIMAPPPPPVKDWLGPFVESELNSGLEHRQLRKKIKLEPGVAPYAHTGHIQSDAVNLKAISHPPSGSTLQIIHVSLLVRKWSASKYLC